MKLIPITLALCIALGGVAFAQKPAVKKKPASASPAPAPKGRAQDLSVDGAEKLLAERKDITVLDVRTVEEYDMAHIPGAKNVSYLDEDFDEKLKEFEGRPVLVHCAAGNRSVRAVMRMLAGGKFPEMYHLPAGFAGWQAAGKSVVKSPAAKK